MAQRPDLTLWELSVISERCARQTELFFKRQPHNPRFCYELWRRAIVLGDTAAWERLYAQYRPLVAGWVRRHSAFSSCGDDVHHLVNCAFEKMWFALDSAKFTHFPNVRSLLRYLQMSVHSAIMDAIRRAENPADLELSTLSDEHLGPSPAVEKQVLDRLDREEFWREILARLKDERERLVVHGSYVLGLKPRELCDEFADAFGDVKEIYRIKENVLARLRRDPEIGQFVGLDA